MAKKDKSSNKDRPSSGTSMTLGIDLGGTKILAGVVDEHGHILGTAKRKTRPERGVDAVIERIASTALDAVADAGLTMDLIDAVGIGAPGVADYNTGVIEFAPNLANWVNVPLGPRLQSLLETPTFVENDVNAGTFGSVTAGVAKGYRSVVGIAPGTGIGGGLVLDGVLWRGARNAAAEFGHMVVLIDGPVCGCGRRGCIEALASRTAIERDIVGELRGGRRSLAADYVDSEGRVTSGALAELLKEKDALVTEVVSRAARHLGIFTASLVNAIDPECVVFGGGLIEACGSFMMPIIRQATYHYLIRPVEPENLPILEAILGDYSVLVGAAMLANASLKAG